jgi:hypothetical protein
VSAGVAKGCRNTSTDVVSALGAVGIRTIVETEAPITFVDPRAPTNDSAGHQRRWLFIVYRRFRCSVALDGKIHSP